MLLEATELRVHAGDRLLLDGISFRLERGQRLGVIGQRDSGKSLLARLLAGQLGARYRASGQLHLNGQSLALQLPPRLPPLRPGIALLTDGRDAGLPRLLRVGEVVSDRLLLDALQLDPAQRIGSLGSARRQLLRLARALAARPEVLVLDEPFTTLDALATKRALNLILAHGQSLVMVGHDLPAMSAIADSLLILNAGRVIERGDTARLLSRPMEDYSRQLIASRRVRARTLMRAPIGTPLLDVEGLEVVYPDHERLLRRRPPVCALADVSFALRRGEALAIVGQSGAGKSTLARVIAGLQASRRGRIVYEGHHAYRGRDLPLLVRPQISLLFADPRRAFDPRLTLGESIAEPLLLDDHHTLEEQTDRLLDVLTGVGLGPEVMRQRPEELDLYRLQLAAVARVLVTRPRLVVMDEPVGLLDAGQRGEMLTLINRVRADFGFTALITASGLDLVRPIADRVLVLDQGRIVEEGRPGELLETPRAAASRALVSARLPEVGLGVVQPVGP